MKPILYKLKEGETKPDAIVRTFNEAGSFKTALLSIAHPKLTGTPDAVLPAYEGAGWAKKRVLNIVHPKLTGKDFRLLYSDYKALSEEITSIKNGKNGSIKSMLKKNIALFIANEDLQNKLKNANDVLVIAEGADHYIKGYFRSSKKLLDRDIKLLQSLNGNGTMQNETLDKAISSLSQTASDLEKAESLSMNMTEFLKHALGMAEPKVTSFTPQSLVLFLARNSEIYEKANPEKKISVASTIGGSDATYSLNETALLLISDNFVSNAVKYSKNMVKISVSDCEGTLSITVSDNGPGMKQLQLDRVFSPKSADFNSMAGSNGVGLACSRIIAGMAGWALSASSAEGKGTSFKLSIPLG